MLQGYRTYVCSALGVIVVLAMGFGYINPDVGATALTLLGFGSLAALRAALRNEALALEARLAAKYGLPPFKMPVSDATGSLGNGGTA